MNCKRIRELLTAYLDGEVTKEEKALVELHLADCSQCQAELESLSATQASLKSVLTSMADEVVPSNEAWENVRAKIERKNGWLESLGNILSNQKWQGAVVTAAVVVVAVSAAVWRISGAGQSPALVAPAPTGNASAVPTTPKPSGTPTTPTTTPPPSPSPITPAPAPITPPAPTPPPPATPPPVATPPVTTPPITAAPPPNITVGAPPPPVTVQAPPPAQVTINPPAVTVQSPPPAQVTVNVPAQSPQLISVPLWFWSLLTVTLLAAVLIVVVFRRRSKV